jgi:hypothetical protein
VNHLTATKWLFFAALLCITSCGEKSQETTGTTPEPVVHPEKKPAQTPAKVQVKAPPKAQEKPSTTTARGWVQFEHKEQMFTASGPAGSETSKVMRKHLVDRKQLAFVYKLSESALGSVHHFTLVETADLDPKKEMLSAMLTFATNVTKKMPKVEDATVQGREAKKFRGTYTQNGQDIVLKGIAVLQDSRRFAIMFALTTEAAESEGERFVRSVVFQ